MRLFLLSILTVLLVACGRQPIDDQFSEWVEQTDGSDSDQALTPDLKVFEVSGPARKIHTVTYYGVIPCADGQFQIPDSLNCTETTVYIDTLGRYVPRRDERVRRDSAGRIVSWEDRRPNLRRIDGGFLRDTLGYTHISENVLTTTGMGEYAVTVYDNDHRIVGQYTDPLTDGEKTAVFNVYLDEDDRGSWTRRMGVWTTQTSGQRPHVSYTLDQRDITYWR